MIGMAMLMAAGTSIAAEGDKDRSISLDPLTTRTIETKSGSSESVPIGTTRIVVKEKADKRDEIIFVLHLVIINLVIVTSSIVFFPIRS
ncbi:hypothetical protein SUGI_1421320 [Cryptomeria japonica]|uniref:Uncharacterized protein n=1 Tax=Cryptomeria japonica TaxID=3369 RepID=A0AAD3NM80_CRYJA|nr:uncharacterized protein LOC131059698 [Cryptomeria japonica]GLJ58145.1 hypothetical protein SUGI_1421320 [Cryptomeria japonica]